MVRRAFRHGVSFEKGEEATVAQVAALLDAETYGLPDVVIKKKSSKTMEDFGD